MATKTLVHVMRHGEVFNPEKVLYGRLPGYKLSVLGLQMAERAAQYFKNNNLSLIVSSPLERAQQTAAPTANLHNLKPQLEVVRQEDMHWNKPDIYGRSSNVKQIDPVTLKKLKIIILI